MKAVYPLLALLCCYFPLSAQQGLNDNTVPPPAHELMPLSASEEKALMELPKLELPMEYKSKDLPAVVDNSTQPYMRQAFQQTGLCCGQAAGIGYNYTYEIDRIRDVPANTNDNLYPTHFTWNWMHGGYGWYGVSYLHSFQILKHCGNVNVTDYGGSLAYGGAERWMSGYDNYYNGMSNRINNVYRIDVGTPEGLEVFKHWINDHLEGAAVGGVGSFYSQYMAVSNKLPAGTPEEGKYVLTYFGGSANHAQTIVGYNDSIRWDYNGDGQYTNHIDINNDGEVNMKDWEIGGFKMVQSYGGVPNWGDQGFAYMMYKTVADRLGQGGIWNHSIHVLDVKEDCNPQATMKVTLTHTSRNKLKVVAGLSNNPGLLSPQYILEYPIFNYQSGNQYMQGGTSNPANMTIEFGLDISPLLSMVNLGQDVKFYLQVFEYDPTGAGTGNINAFSVIDYTDGGVEHVCPQSNVQIVDNGLTTMSVVANFDFDRVHILNAGLPPATVGQPYNTQLLASGGEAPYTFRLLKQYDEDISSETFPLITQTQLYPSNSGSGFVTRALDFDFPYYDSVYSSVTVHVDGYLMFDEQLYPYPYFYDDMNLFRITRHISPFMCHAMRLYSAEGDGIWYEGDDTQATFRWKASIDGNSGTTDINVAVRLFPSGKIEFLYGDIVIGDNILWVPGLCDGNEDDMQFSDFYFNSLPAENSVYEYTRYDYPEGITILEDGTISGTVQQSVNGEAMTFKVTDNNFVSDTKTLLFSTTGILIEDSISSGGNGVIEYGEIANLSMHLTNLEGNHITNASMTISIDDPYISLIDDYEYIGSLPVGQRISLINAFKFQVASDIPDEHVFEVETSISGTRQLWESTLTYQAFAPVISIQQVTVNDNGDGRLDPGETCDLLVDIKNSGGSKASGLNSILSEDDPYITLNDAEHLVGLLSPDSTRTLAFNITADPSTPIGHIIGFNIALSGNMGYQEDLPFDLRVGLTLEDFETGDLGLFSWGFSGGSHEWYITENNPYEGDYCARSGNISHGEQTSLILDLEVLNEGPISFYRRTSCEDAAGDDADYLSFLIDDIEQARWDSIRGWEAVSFNVTEGYHRFEWRFVKDASVSVGSDAAWVDYISLPSCLDLNPHLVFDPEALEKTMKPGEQDTDTLVIINPGQGGIHYTIVVTAATDKGNSGSRSIEGSYLECSQSEFFAGDAFTWDFTLFNGSDDSEWLQDLTIQVPQGITVGSASNFTGGSGGPLLFTGSFGNGPLLHWYGEDASGWGVVQGGEYAYGNFSGVIDPGFTDDALLEYVITGDIYGNEPHTVEGTVTLTNLGGNVEWLSCDVYEGDVAGQDQKGLLVTFNTEGLDDGDYYCNLLVRDNFQNESIIPVHLLVDTDLDAGSIRNGREMIEVFPNPFNDLVNIRYTANTAGSMSLRVIDLTGNTLAWIANEADIPAGEHMFKWSPDTDGKLPAGIYLVVLEHNGKKTITKVVRYP
jgi:hypothetical protein